MKYLIRTLLLILAIGSNHSFAISNLPLPSEVCSAVGATKEILREYKIECNEEELRAVYADLNSDGTKELIVAFIGGSSGDQYYVFQLDTKLKWKKIGNWCGCEDEIPTVKTTKHNGYLDIYTCGVSGFYDGKKYIGKRQ